MATRFLETAKIILGFRDRLIVLNTIEEESGNDREYQNRARWCQNGDPTDATNGWLDDTPGRGGYIDAPTEEAIITADFVKNRLIVYFERSTWELVYTGDATLPFRWQQINNELGAESTFSIVGFDKMAVGIGNVGIHSCNGINVVRIDEKIPDEVFNIHNDESGTVRVYGVRDYYRELVYWTFPDATGGPTYPNRILVWNYKNSTWAFFRDSFTCFGYFQGESTLTWSELGSRYGSWSSWNERWGGARSQSQFLDIITGNQQGFTHIVNTEKTSNERALYITNMIPASSTLTVINHNLQVGDYIRVSDAEGITSLNENTYLVASVTDEDNIIIDTTFTGTYTGAGYLTRISNLNITSKQWNPGTPVGQQFRIPFIDFLLDRTSEGEVSVDYFIDSTSGTSIQDQITNNVLLGTNALYTRPEDNITYQPNQVRIWHRYYMQTQGQFIQIKIFLNDDQIRDQSIAESDFSLDGIILYTEPQGRIIG